MYISFLPIDIKKVTDCCCIRPIIMLYTLILCYSACVAAFGLHGYYLTTLFIHQLWTMSYLYLSITCHIQLLFSLCLLNCVSVTMHRREWNPPLPVSLPLKLFTYLRKQLSIILIYYYCRVSITRNSRGIKKNSPCTFFEVMLYTSNTSTQTRNLKKPFKGKEKKNWVIEVRVIEVWVINTRLYIVIYNGICLM